MYIKQHTLLHACVVCLHFLRVSAPNQMWQNHKSTSLIKQVSSFRVVNSPTNVVFTILPITNQQLCPNNQWTKHWLVSVGVTHVRTHQLLRCWAALCWSHMAFFVSVGAPKLQNQSISQAAKHTLKLKVNVKVKNLLLPLLGVSSSICNNSGHHQDQKIRSSNG